MSRSFRVFIINGFGKHFSGKYIVLFAVLFNKVVEKFPLVWSPDVIIHTWFFQRLIITFSNFLKTDSRQSET